MRSLIIVWACLITLLVSEASQAQNLLSNPSFENSTSDWDIGFWGGPAASFASSTDFAQEGTQSFKANITIASPDDAGKVYLRKNGLRLEANKKYKLEFYLLSKSNKTETIILSLYSHINIGGTAWGSAYSNPDVSFMGDGTLKKMSYEITPTALAGTPDFNSLGLLFGLGKNVSTLYIDNISLSPASGVISAKSVHVSKIGVDTNDGSLAKPFLTISKAASLVGPGDTVYIHAGTYEETVKPATSGLPGLPIVFQSYQNQKVIVTAMQALSGWIKDVGQIYKTNVDWDLAQQNFVMNGTTACDLARWPNNTDGDPFTLDSKRNSGGSAGSVITGAFLTSSEIPNYDWSKGGSLFFYGDKPGAGWTAWKAFITSSSSGRVNFDLIKNPDWIRTVHAPADKGDFYLEGIKEAIDYKNEWFFDSATKTLFLQFPDGTVPVDGVVKMRKRTLTFDLNGRNNIEIRNLAVFGGGIEISGSNNLVYGVTSLYGNHSRGVVSGFSINSQSVFVKSGSSNNTIEKCEVGFGAGSGIRDNGINTKILNNYVHDFNYAGVYDAVVYVREGSGALVKGNKITRGGRDCIQIISKNSEVSYNDISHSNLIADDCGLLYTLGAGLNMKIHHNLFHDASGRGNLYKAAGIYLDNDAGDVSVHHNVVWNVEWNAIQINWNGTNIDVFNNTLINCMGAMGAWHMAGTAFSNVRVWNNLTNMNSLEEQADKKNNMIMPTSMNPFTNLAKGDFTLTPGVMMIDAGRVIPGITDGFIGSNPDVGAYEFGGFKWTAGIDWDPIYSPHYSGCYGLPGEVCSWTTNDDFDGDGIRNQWDKCPETPAGTTVNESGCTILINSKHFNISKLRIFPNPVTNQKLNVDIQAFIGSNSKWNIFSLNGTILKEGTIRNQPGLQIDLTGFEAGVYFFVLNNGDARITEKFIINRAR